MGEAITTNPVEQHDVRQQTALEVQYDSQSSAWAAAADIEAAVFIESKYVESAEELAEEYAKYLPATEFVSAADGAGEIIGSMRIIRYEDGIGIKTFDDIASGRLTLYEEGEELLSQVDPHDVLEVGTLAVRADRRGKPEDEGKATTLLYGALVAECRRYGRRYVVASFDEDYYNRFAQIYGPSCRQLGPATDYMGSKTVPAILDAEALLAHVTETLPGVGNAIAKVAESMR